MDIRFHWLRDREYQEKYCVYWQPENSNYADYLTKHHPVPYHRYTRKEFSTPHIVFKMLGLEQDIVAAAAQTIRLNSRVLARV